jgi:hypothetical protein
MKELALIVIAIIYFLTFVINWKMDERVTRLEALVKCLESEMIELRKKIALNEDSDNE